MKVAILTLTPKNNYGGVLQAVALYGFLESHGYEVTLIENVRYKKPFWVRCLIKIIERLPFQDIKGKRSEFLKSKKILCFSDKYLPNKSEEIISSEDLSRLVKREKFHSVIVGSDQVWRYRYIAGKHYKIFFLNFDVDYPTKRIAYAASFGREVWEAPEHVDEVARLLTRFDAISTREKSGVDICRETFGITKAKNVLDPTMLVSRSFFDRFMGDFSKGSDETLVTYLLDHSQEKLDLVTTVKSMIEDNGNRLRLVNLSGERGGRFYNVGEWLWNLKNAGFVITDSFHGMVFSIIFERQFVVIGNSERGLSRFSDLLETLGLIDRLLVDQKLSQELLETKIDYGVISKKLSKIRIESVRFLLDSLSLSRTSS